MASNPFAYNMSPNQSSTPSSSSPLPGLGGQDLSNYYLNSTPEAGFYNYLGAQGLGGTDTTSKYAGNQYNRSYNLYQAQAADNPMQGFWDFLQQNKPDFRTEFQMQSPGQRGDFSSRFLTPRGRWVTVG